MVFTFIRKMLPKVSEGADREEKREWLSDLVRIVILIWSAGLLTASYVRLPSGQKIMDFDPTFIASVFSGSLAGFGIAAAKAGQTPGANGNGGSLPEAPVYTAKKEEENTEPEVQPVWSEPEPTTEPPLVWEEPAVEETVSEEPETTEEPPTEERPRRGDL
jgi:hypothetical protein